MSAIFGELLTFAQRESKQPVQLRVFGDEFYWRYETPAGYSAVYDHQLGLFCYATLAAGRLVSTGAPITKRPRGSSSPEVFTPPLGLPHLNSLNDPGYSLDTASFLLDIAIKTGNHLPSA